MTRRLGDIAAWRDLRVPPRQLQLPGQLAAAREKQLSELNGMNFSSPQFGRGTINTKHRFLCIMNQGRR
jgi:hypothetical protein